MVWARRLWFTGDGMLRAPWRIALFIIIASIAMLAATVITYPIIRPSGTNLDIAMGGATEAQLVVNGWATVFGLLVAHAVCLRRIDKLPWGAAGLDSKAAQPALLGWSTLLGAVAIGIPALILTALGWLRFQPAESGSSLAEAGRSLLFLAPFAFSEELMLRGYVLTVLRKSLDWRLAVALTSIVFGLLHLANPGSNGANIAMVVLAGVLLGTIVVVTGSLYAAMATHLAWNWVMAGVLHVPVSGLAVATPDYRLVDAGPDWLTGGAWGPEGGLGAAIGMTGALAYLYVRRARPREE